VSSIVYDAISDTLLGRQSRQLRPASRLALRISPTSHHLLHQQRAHSLHLAAMGLATTTFQ
jgi:hypothetical protein